MLHSHDTVLYIRCKTHPRENSFGHFYRMKTIITKMHSEGNLDVCKDIKHQLQLSIYNQVYDKSFIN